MTKDLPDQVKRAAHQDIAIGTGKLSRTGESRIRRLDRFSARAVEGGQLVRRDSVSRSAARLGKDRGVWFQRAERRQQLDRVTFAQHPEDGDQSLPPDEPAERRS